MAFRRSLGRSAFRPKINPSLSPEALREADIAVRADDDMVEHVDSTEVADFAQSRGQLQILSRRLAVQVSAARRRCHAAVPRERQDLRPTHRRSHRALVAFNEKVLGDKLGASLSRALVVSWSLLRMSIGAAAVYGYLGVGVVNHYLTGEPIRFHPDVVYLSELHVSWLADETLRFRPSRRQRADRVLERGRSS
jgi:hypothetical protein